MQYCTSQLEAESAVTTLCPIDRFARPLTRLRPTAGYCRDAFSSPNSCASSDRGAEHFSSTGFRNRLLSSDHFQHDADLLLGGKLASGNLARAADQGARRLPGAGGGGPFHPGSFFIQGSLLLNTAHSMRVEG